MNEKTAEEKKAFTQGWIAKHKLLTEENERLKEALKKLWIAADIILDPLDSEELSQPVYKGLWKEIRNAKKLLKADSQEQNRQPPQPESEQ